MFYGPLAKPRDANDPIVDDDIDPEAFRLMLKYIIVTSDKSVRKIIYRTYYVPYLKMFYRFYRFVYTESIAHDDGSRYHVRRIEPFPTGVELAFETMQAAGKYGIPALYLFCRNYILNDIQKTFRTSKEVAEYGILYALYVSELAQRALPFSS